MLKMLQLCYCFSSEGDKIEEFSPVLYSCKGDIFCCCSAVPNAKDAAAVLQLQLLCLKLLLLCPGSCCKCTYYPSCSDAVAINVAFICHVLLLLLQVQLLHVLSCLLLLNAVVLCHYLAVAINVDITCPVLLLLLQV